MIVSLLKMALETVKLEHLYAIGRKQGGSIWRRDKRTWLADSKDYYRYILFQNQLVATNWTRSPLAAWFQRRVENAIIERRDFTTRFLNRNFFSMPSRAKFPTVTG